MNWEELKNRSLIVYSTSWCPDCTRLEMLLKSKNITFTVVDIDETPEAATELKNATGKTSIPWVKVDNNFFVLGWHKEEPGSWSDKIFFQDIEKKL